MLRKFLFPTYSDNKSSSILLISRVIFGSLLMSHGLAKFANYAQMSESFPDPFGIGSPASLMLAIFGELFCSIAFILGFLYRLATIPMIVTMSVAFFYAHAADPFAVKELAFVYLIIFVLMYIAGPGKYAVDRFFVKK